MAVLPTGELLVTIENPYGLLRVDPVARKVVRKYDVGGESPHMVMLGPDATTAWVSVSGSGLVSIVDLVSGAIWTRLPTGENTQGCVMTRDGKRVYVTNSRSNSISIVNAQSRKVEREIATGAGPNRIFLSPDEKTLLYSFQSGQGMGFADVDTAKDAQTAFLGIQDSDKIVVISVSQRKIIRVFDTPPNSGPDSIEPL
jgi:YVTN family beta-propeller protein